MHRDCPADALDFLGVVGVLRDFSKNTKDLRQAYDITRKRRGKLPGLLCLAKSKEIAAQRLADMDALFAKFEADSFGCFYERCPVMTECLRLTRRAAAEAR